MKRAFSIIFLFFGVLGLCSALLNIGSVTSAVFRDRFLFNVIISIVCFIISFVLKKSGNSYPVAIKSDNYRNFIELTPEAVEFVKKSIIEHKYPSDTALRISKLDELIPTFDVKFDLLSDDDRDWIGESSGIFVMVEKHVAFQIEKISIDAKNDKFVVSMLKKSI